MSAKRKRLGCPSPSDRGPTTKTKTIGIKEAGKNWDRRDEVSLSSGGCVDV